MPELSISTEQIGYLILKAREFDAKESVTDPDPASNASDDNMIDVLEDNADDPVVREITGFVNALSVDEKIDLVALVWRRPGGGPGRDWDETPGEGPRCPTSHIARYLLGQPLLGDLLAEGLEALGLSAGGERTTPVV